MTILTWCEECDVDMHQYGGRNCRHCGGEYCFKCIKEHERNCKRDREEEE